MNKNKVFPCRDIFYELVDSGLLDWPANRRRFTSQVVVINRLHHQVVSENARAANIPHHHPFSLLVVCVILW